MQLLGGWERGGPRESVCLWGVPGTQPWIATCQQPQTLQSQSPTDGPHDHPSWATGREPDGAKTQTCLAREHLASSQPEVRVLLSRSCLRPLPLGIEENPQSCLDRRSDQQTDLSFFFLFSLFSLVLCYGYQKYCN